MLTDHEFAQAVMKAAGVEPSKAVASWFETPLADQRPLSVDFTNEKEALEYLDHRHTKTVEVRDSKVEIIHPCPLTSAEGFLALWDALEAKGWRVEFRTLLDGTLAQVYKADEMGRADLASIFQGGHEDRKAALVEAAGQALGVTR